MDNVPQFYSDWDDPLLIDLKIQQTCDDDYDNVLNFTWPGVEAGCDCTQSNGTGPYRYTKYLNNLVCKFLLHGM